MHLESDGSMVTNHGQRGVTSADHLYIHTYVHVHACALWWTGARDRLASVGAVGDVAPAPESEFGTVAGHQLVRQEM